MVDGQTWHFNMWFWVQSCMITAGRPLNVCKVDLSKNTLSEYPGLDRRASLTDIATPTESDSVAKSF